jgi:hypothetical protein
MSFLTFSTRDFFMIVVKCKIKYTNYPLGFTFCKAELIQVYFISLNIVNMILVLRGKVKLNHFNAQKICVKLVLNQQSCLYFFNFFNGKF